MEYNWTTLTACHYLSLSFKMTVPQQCCLSHNENIQILPLLFVFSSYIYTHKISNICFLARSVTHPHTWLRTICSMFDTLPSAMEHFVETYFKVTEYKSFYFGSRIFFGHWPLWIKTWHFRSWLSLSIFRYKIRMFIQWDPLTLWSWS
jgi:hypothetical protein